MTPMPDWNPATLTELGVEIRRVEDDSSRILPGDLFLAYPGMAVDGRHYILRAQELGAAAVFWDPIDQFVWQPQWAIPNLAVPNLREQAGVIASHVYRHPSQQMLMVGITGTNGKTSISHALAQAFSLLGRKAALIGTVGQGFYGEKLVESIYTTPGAIVVQQKLAEYRRQRADVVTMEVSSHALHQSRVNGVSFTTAVFTNLTRDHLDYHGTMQAYGAAKTHLFHWEGLKHAVINIDDAFGRQLLANIDPAVTQVVCYGLTDGDIRPLVLEASPDGLLIEIATPWGKTEIRSVLLGRFNAANLLACLATLCVNGVSLADAARVLSQVQPARGRMQLLGRAHEPLIIVDYSHTPDALEKALKTLAAICPVDGKLYCVFGCGGERDRGKRPIMGRVAERIADIVVVTTDNPRNEDPQAIIDDILSGMGEAHVELDREAAIYWAVRRARVGDMVLIAGKGHEEYQDANGVKRPFSDLRVAERALTAWGKTHDADVV